MSNFSAFNLPHPLVQTLTRLNIVTPTPVQEQAIPVVHGGGDLLATAQTGTGKTLAYLLPMVAKAYDNAHEQAIILAPTRELADQIKNTLLALVGHKRRQEVVLLIGGAPIFRQLTSLKAQPRFIIGTPGRVIDHLERGTLRLDAVRTVVLDEVDRMLDMGFSEALETIMQATPKTRQTLMFSATMPPNIARLSKRYLREPQHVAIGSTTQTALQIKQEMIKATTGEKFTCLLDALSEREGAVIIFVKTKIGADGLAEKLRKKNHLVDAIHGDLRQRKRESVIRAFRKGNIRIMVATDIAARGLDIPHIKHVINYDLPQCAEDYIHRVGRTGRAGEEGHALSFVSPSESGQWKAIHRLLNGESNSEYRSERTHTNGRRSSNRRDRNEEYRHRSTSKRRPSREEGRGRASERDVMARGDGERRATEYRTPARRATERRTTEGEGRTMEYRAPARRAAERRTTEGRTTEYRAPARRAAERRTAEGHTTEYRAPARRATERRTTEGRTTEYRAPTRRTTERDTTERGARASERGARAPERGARASERGARAPERGARAPECRTTERHSTLKRSMFSRRKKSTKE